MQGEPSWRSRGAWLATLVAAMAILWGLSHRSDPVDPRGVGDETGERIPRAVAREGVPAPASMERIAATEASGSSAVVFVHSMGVPIEGACVTALDASDIYVGGPDRSPARLETDGEGRCQVPVSGPLVFAVTREGYLPGHAAVPGPASTCVVELRRCVETGFEVKNERGNPVAGFAIAFVQGITGREELQRIVAGAAGSGLRVTSRGFVALAVTDAAGVARLSLPEGTHKPMYNATNLPLIVKLDRSAGVVEAGQRCDVVVSEPLACVVRLQGDDIVLSRAVSVNMGFAGSHQAALVRSEALQRLRARFPGCVVECGLDTGRGAASVRLYVCGRYSGVTQYTVECLPVSTWEAPRVLDVATAGQPMVTQMHVHMENPDGRRLDVTEGDLLVQVECGGKVVSFDIPDGGAFEAPLGTVKVVASPRLPSDVEPVVLELERGKVARLAVRLDRPLFRGRLAFVDTNGDVPLLGSVDYGTPDRMRTRMMAVGGTIDALFEVGATYVARFNGRTVRGELALDTARDPNDRQERTIRIE